ncbi:flagellar hook-basal body protein [Halalkalibacillus sediminis]|uniref:Flagellar hook-basal body protein n=1 Tax=Halalkalibacillus sediminis TaxID=2018042 RepID=A0A2I0QTW8_9BACI|nr:flagellar hook-basal body protein [Halalkalibacillus sediminis]PKR77766.1 flagellar hook-basal body protein [Halalkalibacillus sediminis]
MRSMLTAATTMNQLQSRMDLQSNNLANLNTYGYKGRQSNFSSLLFQQVDNIQGNDADSPRLTPEGIRQGAGSRLAHTNMNMNVGTLQTTERELDVAIQDRNRFFVVNAQVENGETEQRFTRSGNFYLQPINGGEQSMLTTSEGNPVAGQNGPILIDEGFDGIRLTDQGGVEVTRNGQTAVEGNLQVVDIERTRGLEPVGANSYRLDLEGLGVPADELVAAVAPAEANLAPGALEASNVNFGQEMTSLIESQRAYSFNAQAIRMGDQMMGLIGSMRS